jgi:hypothetical protein
MAESNTIESQTYFADYSCEFHQSSQWDMCKHGGIKIDRCAGPSRTTIWVTNQCLDSKCPLDFFARGPVLVGKPQSLEVVDKDSCLASYKLWFRQQATQKQTLKPCQSNRQPKKCKTKSRHSNPVLQTNDASPDQLDGIGGSASVTSGAGTVAACCSSGGAAGAVLFRGLFGAGTPFAVASVRLVPFDCSLGGAFSPPFGFFAFFSDSVLLSLGGGFFPLPLPFPFPLCLFGGVSLGPDSCKIQCSHTVYENLVT